MLVICLFLKSSNRSIPLPPNDKLSLIYRKSLNGLNSAKTYHLIVEYNNNISQMNFFSINLKCFTISSQNSLRNLCIIMDPYRNFEFHASTKLQITHSRLRSLHSRSCFLARRQKLHLSSLLLIFLFDYANVVYYACLTKRISKCIQQVRDACFRFSFGISKYNHITPSFGKSS